MQNPNQCAPAEESMGDHALFLLQYQSYFIALDDYSENHTESSGKWLAYQKTEEKIAFCGLVWYHKNATQIEYEALEENVFLPFGKNALSTLTFSFNVQGFV